MIDEIGGQISVLSSESMNNYKNKKDKWKFELQKNEIQEIKNHIGGFWCKFIEFDGIKYWEVEKDSLFDLIQH